MKLKKKFLYKNIVSKGGLEVSIVDPDKRDCNLSEPRRGTGSDTPSLSKEIKRLGGQTKLTLPPSYDHG